MTTHTLSREWRRKLKCKREKKATEAKRKGVELPKNKRGRKKKKSFNFSKKSNDDDDDDDEPSPPPSISTRSQGPVPSDTTMPLNSTAANRRSTSLSTVAAAAAAAAAAAQRAASHTRSTRSTTTIYQTRHTVTPPTRYEAGPSPPTKPGHNNEWIGKLKGEKESLKAKLKSNRLLLRNLSDELAGMKEQQTDESNDPWKNHHMVDKDVPLDASDPILRRCLSGDEVKAFAKRKLYNNEGREKELHNVLHSLGLSRDGKFKPSKEESKEKLLIGFQLLVDIHFKNYCNQERADIVGEALFNGQLFGSEGANYVATKVAKTTTSRIFSTIALLRCMDRSAGALNDSAIDQYAKIEEQTVDYKVMRGHSMLHKRWKISNCRKIADEMVKTLLQVQHHEESEHGEYIHLDIKSLFRLSLKAYGLEKKAIEKGILMCITADGVEIANNGMGSQCGFAMKIVDEDARDITTGELLFVKNSSTEENGDRTTGDTDTDTDTDEDEDNMDEEDDTPAKEYENAQSSNTCHLIAMYMQNETKALVRKIISEQIDVFKDIEKNGLPPECGEPAICPCKLIVNADASCIQKICNRGGACKVQKFFCSYCECTSDERDMFMHLTGENR
jgi:hypothetical protein